MSLKPGWYRATVAGRPDTLVLVGERYAQSTLSVDRGFHHRLDEVKDVKPLIVLDLETPVHYAEILRRLADRAPVIEGIVLVNLANQIEAQTRPPRMLEPGLWGIVKAHCGHSDTRGAWVRDSFGWARIDYEHIRTHNHDAWDDLIDPTPIRPGIGDES